MRSLHPPQRAADRGARAAPRPPARRWLGALLLAALLLAVRGGAAPDEPAPQPITDEGSPTMNDAHGPERSNRLAGESSPYLLLHQHNPVDWYPWGEEALERARRESKPIFLSVGYSTCYWCHVMERESFSDPEIAALMNEHFVNVKVDREERPDLDEIYMTATQLLTRHGGWPNSVFLTPDLEPFYAGTYFPPRDRAGRPGFATILASLADAWENQREEVVRSARQVAEAMQRVLDQGGPATGAAPGAAAAERALADLAQRFDAEWGGFGGAPKFPTPSNLLLLLELHGEARAAEMLAVTLDRMARGGIYDQLGGGFHRYSTDRRWLVPHFEKMLYDNGFLLEIYARHHALTGDAQSARVVRETAAFLAREMSGEGGALWSAIDAETDGDEGAYYVWSRDQLEATLTPVELELVDAVYGTGGEPNFEGGRQVLHLPRPLAELAAARDLGLEVLHGRLAGPKGKLLAARSRRERPLTDDKILADWNGIAITGLATAGEALGEPALIEQAARAARFVLARLRPEDGPLLHSWRDGRTGPAAFLADYAFLTRGLLALHRATGEAEWLAAAVELADEQAERLGDPRGGFFVAAEADDLLLRSKDATDGALPSANAIAALGALELARLTGEERWRRRAENTVAAFGGLLEAAPQALAMMSIAARRLARDAGGAAPRGAGEALAAEAEAAVRATLEVDGPGAQDGSGGWRAFRLALDVADGWHVNAHPASDELLVATAVEGIGVELRDLRYPPGKSLEASYADRPIAVYDGRVEIRGELRAPAGAGAEASALRLTYQACTDDRCLPPVTRSLAVR